jgi:integrase
MAFGLRRGCCSRNPVRDLDVDERPTVEKTEPRILLPDEIALLLEHATDTYRPALAILAYTGLRASEALGLTWEDIDLKDGVIHVRAQLERARGDRRAERRKLKTAAARRLVPIPGRLREILLRHKEDRFALGLAAADDYVNGTATGAPIRYDNLRTRGLQAAAKKASLIGDGKKPLRLHDLRHGYGSMLIRAGDDIGNVSRRLGHASPSITLSIYAHEINEAATLQETRQLTGPRSSVRSL